MFIVSGTIQAQVVILYDIPYVMVSILVKATERYRVHVASREGQEQRVNIRHVSFSSDIYRTPTPSHLR